MTDGEAPSLAERSASFTIAFDEVGQVTGLALVGPSGHYWPTDMAQLSQVGDSDTLWSFSEPVLVTQDVVLTELSYSPGGATLVCGDDFAAKIIMIGYEFPVYSVVGTATLTVDVGLAGDRREVFVQAAFDYQQEWPYDDWPPMTHQILETWTASGTLE